MTKELNVAMIGYGFMGKAHSNAYKQVANFFPELEHRPRLKCLSARNAEKAGAFAETWGYESVETDWRKVIETSTSSIFARRMIHTSRSPSPQRRLASGWLVRSRSP
jgi:predicted dehydrogenase